MKRRDKLIHLLLGFTILDKTMPVIGWISDIMTGVPKDMRHKREQKPSWETMKRAGERDLPALTFPGGRDD